MPRLPFYLLLVMMLLANLAGPAQAAAPNEGDPAACNGCRDANWPSLPLACLPDRAVRWDNAVEREPCHCPPQSYCPVRDAVIPEELTFFFDFTVIGSKPPFRECSWSKPIHVTCVVQGTEIEGLQDILRRGVVFSGDWYVDAPDLLTKLKPLVQARCQNQDIMNRKEQCGHPGGAWVALDVTSAVDTHKTLLDWVNDTLQMPTSLASHCCNNICPSHKIPALKTTDVQIVTKNGNGEGTYEDCEDETKKLQSLQQAAAAASQAASAAAAAVGAACSPGKDGQVDHAGCSAASASADAAAAAASAAQQAADAQIKVKEKACDIPTYSSQTISVQTVTCGMVTHYPREGCVIEGTAITMADGTTKKVEELKIGDLVKGNEGASKVVAATKFTQEKDFFYSINGGTAFFTVEHPILTKDGWKSVDPSITSTKGSATKILGKLKVGDTILSKDGEVVVTSIEKHVVSGGVSAYNLKVEGNGSFIANNIYLKGFNQMQMHY